MTKHNDIEMVAGEAASDIMQMFEHHPDQVGYMKTQQVIERRILDALTTLTDKVREEDRDNFDTALHYNVDEETAVRIKNALAALLTPKKDV